MASTQCSECDEEIDVTGRTRLGQKIICGHCGAQLEVVSVEPLEVEIAQEDEEDLWGDEDDDLDEELDDEGLEDEELDEEEEIDELEDEDLEGIEDDLELEDEFDDDDFEDDLDDFEDDDDEEYDDDERWS